MSVFVTMPERTPPRENRIWRRFWRDGEVRISDARRGTHELLEGGDDQLERHLRAHLEHRVLEHLRQVNQVGLSRCVARSERTPPSLSRREVFCNQRV